MSPENDKTKMYSSVPQRCFCLTSLKQLISIRLFLFLICISLMISLFRIQVVERNNLVVDNETLLKEPLENVVDDHKYTEVNMKKDKEVKDIKYILLWTAHDYAPFYFFGKGQEAFIRKNCPESNCYVTDDRRYFGGDTTKFHAIAFNGRNLNSVTKSQLPTKRSMNQKFIYLNMESADNYPICNNIFDNFFNWTSTYRLDSDIPYPYIQIKNSKGEVVGPKKNMEWTVNNTLNDDDLKMKLRKKTKAVAWFVSHCSSRNGRGEQAKQLKAALQTHGLVLDIYGACGTLKCPRDKKTICDSYLENDYFFYLSFENSFAEDYVTEKLLTALQHNVVPIVFGGADYSRFLAPGSYLDARSMSSTDLATVIANLTQSSELYSSFFRWKSSYTYHDPIDKDNVCAICAALNNREIFEKPSVYRNIRGWWHPNYEDRCKT